MFDSIQDLNKFVLLAVAIIVTIGYTGRKAGKLRRRKRRAQYRNLTRPTALTHDAINEAGDEPQYTKGKQRHGRETAALDATAGCRTIRPATAPGPTPRCFPIPFRRNLAGLCQAVGAPAMSRPATRYGPAPRFDVYWNNKKKALREQRRHESGGNISVAVRNHGASRPKTLLASPLCAQASQPGSLMHNSLPVERGAARFVQNGNRRCAQKSAPQRQGGAP